MLLRNPTYQWPLSSHETHFNHYCERTNLSRYHVSAGYRDRDEMEDNKIIQKKDTMAKTVVR